MRDSLDASLISYSQKGAQNMAMSPRLPLGFLSHSAPPTTTLNISMMEIWGKK